ncbi:MAG: HD-GYP domain-containing protein [Phycisphaerales bacterium]
MADDRRRSVLPGQEAPVDDDRRLASDRREESRDDTDRRRHRDAIFAFARAAERHDADTGRHLLRIGGLSRALARHVPASIAPDDPERFGDDAMLHDVGKLCVDPALLTYDGPLSPEQRAAIEHHTIHGDELLAGFPDLARARGIARSHHERWDGTGYPDRLAGEAIPASARIVSAADILDALASPRAYKAGWAWDVAIQHVVDLGGTVLDPQVARAVQRADSAGALHDAWLEGPDPARQTG